MSSTFLRPEQLDVLAVSNSKLVLKNACRIGFYATKLKKVFSGTE
jgi:hypothetical protein